MTARAAGIEDVIRNLIGTAPKRIPRGPPDAFCLMAAILHRSGAYTAVTDDHPPCIKLPKAEKWPEYVCRIGNEWHVGIRTREMTFAIRSPIIPCVADRVALPAAWVVKCKKCGCTVTCRAIDSQLEHAQPERAEPPPHDTVIVSCSCCWSAYRYSPNEVFKGSPVPSQNCASKRSSAGPNRNNSNNKEAKNSNSVLLIAASLIAAVRLNREEIKSSPAVYSKITDSIRLAEMIQARLRG